MDKWEYKIERININTVVLNAFGDDGWELVAIMEDSGWTNTSVFKRKIDMQKLHEDEEKEMKRMDRQNERQEIKKHLDKD